MLRRLALALVSVVVALPAHAGNTGSFFLGNGAALTGGAVVVVGDDGASLWYNPAGLVVARRDRVDLSGSAYMLRVRDYPGVLRGDLPDRPTEEDPLMDLSSTDVLVVPASLAFVRQLGPDLALGFGVFVPLLDDFDATSEIAVRDDAVNLDASVELAAATTVYTATVGLGWRVSSRLRLGASLALYYQAVDVAQTLLFGYESPATSDDARGNGAVVLEDAVERFGFNVFVGAQWQVSDDFGIGLVVRTPLVQVFESFERRRFQLGADVAPDGTTNVVTSFAPARRAAFDAAVFFNFAVTLGLAWTPGEHDYLGLEVDVQPGSEDDGIVRDFVWNARLGGMLALSDTVRIGAGLFTDHSWEPEPETAWVERVHYYGVTGGVTFETPIRLVDAGADSLVFVSTIALRYAIGFGETVRAVADPSGFGTDPTMTPVELTFHEIGVHVGSGLKF